MFGIILSTGLVCIFFVQIKLVDGVNGLLLITVSVAGLIFGDIAAVLAGRFLNRFYLKEDTKEDTKKDSKEQTKADSTSRISNNTKDGEDANPADVDYYIDEPVKMGVLSGIAIVSGLVIAGIWLVLMCGCGRFGVVATVLYMVTSLILLILSIIDLTVYEIPFIFNVLIAGLGLIRLFTDLDNWYVYAVGAVLVSGIFYIINLCTNGRGMGLGDVKLMAVLGLLLGWKLILLCMILGCVLGAVIHSIRMAVSKKEAFLAFGPYLSLAAVICMCVGDKIVDWYFRYFSSTIQ